MPARWATPATWCAASRCSRPRVADSRALLGPKNLQAGILVQNLVDYRLDLGELELADANAAEALAILGANFAPDSMNYALTVHTRAMTHLARRRAAAALAEATRAAETLDRLRRCRATKRRSAARTTIALALMLEGRLDAAARGDRRASRRASRRSPPTSALPARVALARGTIARLRGDPAGGPAAPAAARRLERAGAEVAARTHARVGADRSGAARPGCAGAGDRVVRARAEGVRAARNPRHAGACRRARRPRPRAPGAGRRGQGAAAAGAGRRFWRAFDPASRSADGGRRLARPRPPRRAPTAADVPRTLRLEGHRRAWPDSVRRRHVFTGTMPLEWNCRVRTRCAESDGKPAAIAWRQGAAPIARATIRTPATRAERAPGRAPLLEREPELALLCQRIAALRGGRGRRRRACCSAAKPASARPPCCVEAARRAGSGVDGCGAPASRCCRRRRWARLVDLARSHAARAGRCGARGAPAADVLAGVLAMLRDRRAPTVLVIDDVQWADGATLDLLRYLGRRIESTSALLILSYRDDALGSDHPLLGVLAGLPRAQLHPPAAGAAVARRRCRAGAASRPQRARPATEVTQGNPFFVTELLAGDPQTLPASVRDAVLARVAPLPPAARDVLELASVAPTQIEVEVLDAVVDDARAAIASCTAAGLLQLDGGVLRFRHELARRADRGVAVAGSRRRVARRGVRCAERARRAGGAPGSPRGAGWPVGRRAGAGAAGRARSGAGQRPPPGRRAVRAGARARGGPCRCPSRPRCTWRMPDECQLVDRVDDAMASRRAALALHRQLGDRLGRRTGPARAGASSSGTARAPQAGLPYVQAAIEVLEGIDAPRELAMAYATMAQLHLLDETSQSGLRMGPEGARAARWRRTTPKSAWPMRSTRSARRSLRSQDVPEAWALSGPQPATSRSSTASRTHAGARLPEHRCRCASCTGATPMLEPPCEQGIAYCEAHDLDMLPVPAAHPPRLRAARSGQWDAAEAEIDSGAADGRR